MNRKKVIIAVFATLFSLSIGVGIPALAAETNTQGINSQNTLKFESDKGSIAIYGDDIQLLAEKIYTVPTHIWTPDSYTHTHTWEYINTDAKTHTKHCAECGSQNDTTTSHKATLSESYDISYGGKKYEGLRYTCECGYQWTQEITHHFIYAKTDEKQHTVSCLLNGTSYCTGFDSYMEAHTFGEPIAADTTHHIFRCTFCDAEITEECVFEDTKDDTGITLYCMCGNSTLAILDPETDDLVGEPDGETDDQTDKIIPITPEIETIQEQETISSNSLSETM